MPAKYRKSTGSLQMRQTRDDTETHHAVFVRFMRNSKHLARNTKTHYIVWYSIVAFNISISFVLALGIPVFNNLLSLIGALLGSCEFLRLWP